MFFEAGTLVPERYWDWEERFGRRIYSKGVLAQARILLYNPTNPSL